MAKKIGRPSKFPSLNQKQVETLAKRGFTDKEMSDFFEISLQAWKLWKSKHQDFLSALKDWKLSADSLVEKSLFERAVGYEHSEVKIFCNQDGKITQVETTKHYAPDPTSMIFWLKNRKPKEWRDKIENAVDMKSGGKVIRPVIVIGGKEKPAADGDNIPDVGKS